MVDQIQSRTAWEQQGFRVGAGEEPHDWVKGWREYAVYREDQVEPYNRRKIDPPKLVPILNAVWTLNRHAKRLRDRAGYQYDSARRDLAGKTAKRKANLYDLKSQSLAWLLREGALQVVGYHRFGSHFAEVLQGGGYTFHRPCPPPPEDIDDIKDLDGIGAKTKTKNECRLIDAICTVERYLAGREKIACYQWSRPYRPPTRYRHLDDDDE